MGGGYVTRGHSGRLACLLPRLPASKGMTSFRAIDVQMSKPIPEMPGNFAAAYVRMSTEHQQYSTSNQMDVIRDYAKRRGLEIVKEYSDEGKSGLSIAGRESLSQMIK